jgi:hypothetical protein
MRFPSFPTSSARPSATGLTRHDQTAERRRSRRTRLLGISGAAATAVVACTGFVGASVSGATLPIAQALPTAASASAGSTAPTSVSVTREHGDRISVHAGSAVPRQTADTIAQLTLFQGQHAAAAAKGKVSTRALSASLASLADYRTMNPDVIVARVAVTQHVTASVGKATFVADRRIAAARSAARTAAAKKAAAAQAQADAQRQLTQNTPAAAKATAQALMASQYGWGSDQFSCLSSLWTKESGWNYKAYNPSGASGIPQALPGSKMSSVAADWSTNATTQVIWGLRYISGSYGTPCAAWSHSQAVNWY